MAKCRTLSIWLQHLAIEHRAWIFGWTAEQRALIERAVSLKGSTLTQWTAQHLLEAAQREIEEASSLKLENEAFDAFLRALDEPVPAEMAELMQREPQWA